MTYLTYNIRELKTMARKRAEFREHHIGSFRSTPDGRLRAKCRTCGAPIDLAHNPTSDADISGHCLDFVCPKYRPWAKREWPSK